MKTNPTFYKYKWCWVFLSIVFVGCFKRKTFLLGNGSNSFLISIRSSFHHIGEYKQTKYKITLIPQYKCTMHTIWKCSSVPISWLIHKQRLTWPSQEAAAACLVTSVPHLPHSECTNLGPTCATSALHKTGRTFVYIKLLALC